ncbi:MAG: NapC/NirT family cytochrome c [Acidobacteriota bacterium]
MVLTTASAVLFGVVFLADVFGLHTNPYIGIVFFLVLPFLFVVGLALIPIGAWIERGRRLAGLPPAAVRWPLVDLNDARQRTIVITIFCLTMANVVIVSLGAYRGVEYMDSVQFCGQVCHAPMAPEFAAHAVGPHAQVKCVDCHVGTGASSYAKAKLAGTRRVVGVILNNYPRPIVAASDQVISARETCETCHWPARAHADKVRRIVEYADDEKNTPSVTTLRVHVGGGDGRHGLATGIHWHMNVGNRIEYVATDDSRQTIPYVRMTDGQGNVREYVGDGATPELLAKGARRQMDCLDCHNRPSHVVTATAERAVNEAMAEGGIPTTLPFAHREAVKVLKAEYPTQQAGVGEISRRVRDFYQKEQPAFAQSHAADIDRAISTVQDIYARNVFPDMKVRFGTYPNNIGHIDFPGCFRCHDDNHKSRDGKKISQDCDICHAVE